MSMLLLTMGPQLSVMRVPTSIAIGSAGAVKFRAIGANGPVTWTLLHSDLPGEWGGTLTSVGDEASIVAINVVTAGTYSVTVRAVDGSRQPVIYTTHVFIAALPIVVSGALPNWDVGIPVTGSLTISGGSGVYVGVTVAGGALPPGVTISLTGSNVIFSGSPSSGGSGFAVIRVEDDLGAVGQVSVLWDVEEDEGDPYWDEVVALLHFENGFTDEKAFSWTNSGNLITGSQFRFGTSSLSTGSGYTTVSNNILGLTDSDSITFEGWVRFSSYILNGVIFQLGPNNDSSGGRVIGLRMNAEGSLGIYFGITASTVCSAAIPDFALDRWYFVVAQVGPRISGRRTANLFVDGVLLASGGPADLSTLTSSYIFSLGQGYWSGVQRMDGYIDEFRITKGVARYTEDFDPPTSPFPNFVSFKLTASPAVPTALAVDEAMTPITFVASGGEGPYAYSVSAGSLPSGTSFDPVTGVWSGTPDTEDEYSFTIKATGVRGSAEMAVQIEVMVGDPHFANVTSLLGVVRGEIVDAKGLAWTTSGDVGVTSSNQLFGKDTISLPGEVGDYIQSELTSAFDFATGDKVTVDIWIMRNSGSGNRVGLAALSGASRWAFFTREGNPVNLAVYDGGTVLDQAGPALGAWALFSYVKDGTANRLYIDGALVETATKSTSGYAMSTLYVGQNGLNAQNLHGQIAQIRITKGVARYVSSFTPPSKPFPLA